MQQFLRHLSLLILFSLLLSAPLTLADTYVSDPIVFDDAGGSHFINEMDFLELDKEINILDVAGPEYFEQWAPYQERRSTELNNVESLWFRFTIDTSRTTSADWLLVIHQGVIRHAQLYLYNHDTQQWWQSRAIGLNYPLEQRYYKTRNLTVPVEVTPGQQITAYLNVKAPSLIAMPLSVKKADDYENISNIELLLIGGFLGGLTIMLLYNISLFVVLRDPLYFVYSFYIFVVIFYQLIITGLGPLYFWYSNVWMNDYGAAFFSSLTFLSACLFFRIMLDLKKIGGIMLHSNTAILALWSISTVIAIYSTKVWPLINFGSSLTSVVGLAVAGYLAFVKRQAIARIFLFAWIALMVSTAIFIAALNGVIPFNSFTGYAQMFGFLSEMVLLSFALSYRINKDKRIREQAQADALQLTKRVSEERKERLRAQKETLELQKSLNEQLENQVGQRTEQLRDALKQLESANDELTQLSLTDPLTLLHNRRFFDQALAREYRRAHRAKQSIAVILVDIDYFKKINDEYGHMVGDDCLKRVANTLAGVGRRPGDVLARYGGEEFVYVLPGNTLDSAKIVAEKAREAIEKIHFVFNELTIPLTASFGVAAWIPGRENDFAQLVSSADEALYSAKGAGRNCVMSLPPEPRAIHL